MRDDSAFVLRERHPWESIDLGALMLRRWFRRIAPATIAILAATTAAVLLVAGDRSWIALIALWWLKPLLDRFAAAPAGVLLFSPRSSRKEISAPLRRSLGPSLLADLSWRRFSPWRAYLLASRIFERAPAPLRARRFRDLLADSRGWIIGTTILFEILEWGLAYIITSSATNYLGLDWAYFGTEGFATSLAISYALVLCLTEPLYALSCFCLYINRRTIAEGWDLDLAFKRLAARSKEARSGGAKAMAIFVALALSAAGSLPSAAQSPGNPEAEASFSERARTVLEDPVFGTPRTEKRIMLRRGDDEDEEDDAAIPGAERVETLFDRLSAEGLRIAIAVLAVGLVATAIVVNRRSIALAFAGRGAKAERYAAGFDGPASRRAFPEELAAARDLWQAGDCREALALVYDASVRAASKDRGWRLDDASTEGDCLREAKRIAAAKDAAGAAARDAAFAEAFSRATKAWSRFAWAGAAPGDEEFATLVGALEEAAK